MPQEQTEHREQAEHNEREEPARASLLQPVLVRGASCELGLALMQHLSGQGVQTLGLCHSEAGVARVQAQGERAICVPSPEELPGALAALEFGAPAAYVDFAHSRTEALVASLSPEAIDTWSQTDIALRARFLRVVARLMLPGRRPGRCLFVSSVAAERPAEGQGFYAAAKMAGETLFNCLGVELGRRGITSLSLRLGLLETGRGRDFAHAGSGEYADLVPVRRLVDTREVVETMAFLLSRGASGFNATTLTLDGGFSRTKPGLR